MNGFFQTLAALAVVCTAVLAVSPEGELKKYVKLCCALCAVSVFVSLLPLSPSSYGTGFEAYEVEDLSGEAVRLTVERTLSNVEEAVYSAAEQKYGIKKDGLTVKAEADMSDIQNVKLTVIKCEVRGLQYAIYMKSLQNYISDSFGCVCEVRYAE